MEPCRYLHGLHGYREPYRYLLLGKWAIKALDDYTEQRNAGKDPVFVADKVEGLPKTQCWHIGEDDLKDVGEQPVKEYFADAMEAKPLE